MTLDERRRFEWFLRFGVGMTLDEIAGQVGVTRESVRTDLKIVDARCALHWKKLVATSPAVRRLRAVNALPCRLYFDRTDGYGRSWSRTPKIPPMEAE